MLAPVLAAARARAEMAGLAFSVSVGESLPATLGGIDATRLRQMLDNLLDNAFKLTRSGEIGLAVDRIERRGDIHLLRFAVRDSGPGFPRGQAEQLFERFHRLDETLPGTGIGLSLVRRYARAFGGDAQAEALPAGGAVVWFSVAVQDGAPARGDADPAVSGRPTILVVDDDPAGRLVMTAMLRQFGCEVIAADSAPEALDVLRRHRVDAVTMDMTMRGMNGGEATRVIRDRWPGRALPVIAVTGRVSESDRRLFRQAGADGFVAKPVSPRAVLAALRQAGVVAPDKRSSPAAA
jgi:CheY-like chemotaxis protein